MTKPLVTFADPEAVARTYLAAQFSPRAEVYKPATIGNTFPSTTLSGNTTHLQVELDGAVVDNYPVTERATLRVTVHAAPTAPTNAKSLAALTLGLLYAFPGNASAYSAVPLTGRLKAVDPATKNQMVSFTVRLNMRPTAA